MFLRMHSLLFDLHSKRLMLDTYATFHITDLSHLCTGHSAYNGFVILLED